MRLAQSNEWEHTMPSISVEVAKTNDSLDQSSYVEWSPPVCNRFRLSQSRESTKGHCPKRLG
eukprot:4945259-Amphidinium_carterae.1